MDSIKPVMTYDGLVYLVNFVYKTFLKSLNITNCLINKTKPK